jgi:hypothetical protein
MAKIRKELSEAKEKRLEAEEIDLEYENKSFLKSNAHHFSDNNLKQPIYITKNGKFIGTN